ncbi:DMT family transporter [Geoalkalibacter halelectricus]|uniref:DMT family transporter n=1 Tax=Geoalkalibacter halelectricus TaxID=2847045 RepID=A0ABY5ZIK8_9BACT|nr:DMT family transporter [Geoalkalibacter halelectricus]MDO3377264.1 DMT family transporter [Geoalkalibacter halelectricus]UWZ78903.1 DMT family transporter [Geoalkalibacter halelectricus]
MPEWYLFSVAALVLLGTQRFLYKVAAERDCSATLTTAVFMATVTLLSGLAFFITAEPTGNLHALALLALINSLAFTLATVANLQALKHLPAAITFPLTRLSLLVVIVFSMIYFGERPGLFQWLGIALGFAVVALLAREAGSATRPHGKTATGMLLIAVCVLCGAAAAITSKFAAVSTSKAGFMALSYFLATLFALGMGKKWPSVTTAARTKDAVKIGVLMGLLNFFGFYAFLIALESGPLSIIALITGMHFVIAIALSALIYREQLTPPRLLAIALTLLAVFFIQL